MSAILSLLMVKYRRDPERFRAEYDTPVLVWDAKGGARGESWEQTRGLSAGQPLLGDPRVFRLCKADHADDAFALGITVGRVDSTDVVLVDDSVSRFHAFFQFDAATRGWTLSDAESRNGTWVGDLRLAAGVKSRLGDGTAVRFGDATLTFMLPSTFHAWLEHRDRP